MPYANKLYSQLDEIKQVAIRQIRTRLGEKRLYMNLDNPGLLAVDEDEEEIRWVSGESVVTKEHKYRLENAVLDDLIWILSLLESGGYKDYGGKIE